MSENTDDLKTQLIELQTQLAFQEDTIAALDAVITGQGRDIDRLSQLCDRLARQNEKLPASRAESVDDEVPPHY